MTKSMFATYREGIELFRPYFPHPGPRKRIFPHEVKLPPRNRRGAMSPVKVMEDRNVVVHGIRVYHGKEVKESYAYRFDIKSSGKSVVFSGDVGGPDKNLVTLAQDCDLLVHEAQLNSFIPKIVASAAASTRAALQAHLEDTHTNVVDLPRIAKAANAKRLCMCHLIPAAVPPAAFLGPAQQAAVTAGFSGEIIVPQELDQIAI
jgi:ribonuclease BN (tRNA processing enzyme)